MTYDLDLFVPQTNIDPITTIQRAALHSDSASHETNLGLVQMLERDNPDFDVQTSSAAIDILEQIHGIKVSLYHSGGQISIPYWHTDEATQRVVFWNVRRYMRLIQSETHYAIYDSQLGRIVDVETDMSAIVASYRRVIADMASFYGNI